MKTTTKWNGHPLQSPCYYKEACTNESKGLINGIMCNCRTECESYIEYEKLHSAYITIDSDRRNKANILSDTVATNINRMKPIRKVGRR